MVCLLVSPPYDLRTHPMFLLSWMQLTLLDPMLFFTDVH